MPSSQMNLGTVAQPLSNLGFQVEGQRPPEILISPLAMCAVGQEFNSMHQGFPVSSTYPTTNLAMGFMFCLADSFLVQKAWWFNGATATTNNADVAVYSEDGATRVVAAGSTLITGASIMQEVDVTDTLLPGPARYWCVYNQNGTTATPTMFVQVSVVDNRITGLAQFAGAVALGTTFTPAAFNQTLFPYFGIAGRVKAA